MAQATHHSTRFHNLSNEALADVLGHADAVLKGAEAECKALKGEAKRRGLLEATGENFAIRVAEQISGRLDVAAVKEHLEDLEETEDGLRVRIRQSMTDQEGRGVVIAIPLGQVACPVKSLKAWLHASGITSGPVFRPIGKGERLLDSRLTDRSVAKIVKIHAARAELDPAQFAGHSLRSGFLTSAASHGASIFKMADQSRHKSMDTLRGYVRDAEIFKDHAGKGLL